MSSSTRRAGPLNVPSVPALDIHGLGKCYGPRWIVKGFDLRIEAAQSVALLGESGVGKSTLLNMIAGLEPVDEGTISIGGHPISAMTADASAALRRRAIGFVFQAFHLLPQLDTVQNVAVPLLLNGVPWPQALPRAQAWLAKVGLSQQTGMDVRTLSGGEQQRVALARALVHEPGLILADEPTGNLDPKTAAQVLEVLRECVTQNRTALLLVTHSEQAAAITDRRLVMK